MDISVIEKRMPSMPFLNGVRNLCMAGLLFLVQIEAIADSTLNGITVVTPADGSVVRPGTDVPISIQVDSALNPTAVHVITKLRTNIPALHFSQPPYDGILRIPGTLGGNVTLFTFAQTPDGEGVIGPEISVKVIPASAPVAITAIHSLTLTSPGQKTSGRSTTPIGTYSDGTRHGIARAETGTTYDTSDPTVVTVGPDGLLTAAGLGVAYVAIRNGGASTFTQVIVRDSVTGAHPVIEVTARASITANGFRKDQTSDRYLQDVTIKNGSDLPISLPLKLIVVGLPYGVTLVNAEDHTSHVAPLGSPLVYVQAYEPDYISPGGVATARLEFLNPDRVPINYTLKLFIAGPDL
jgi:hypothetical protein